MPEFNPMLLIAVPQLLDPNFKRSVILILHHDKEGSFGLVVNDPMSLSLEEFSESQKIQYRNGFTFNHVYCGGPVEPYRGWLLHQNEEIVEKQEVFDGLYVSGTNETLKSFLEEDKGPFLFLLGYSGWGPGQLEKEMEEGSWITTAADPKYVFFNNPEDTWDAMLHDMGVDPARLALGTGLH